MCVCVLITNHRTTDIEYDSQLALPDVVANCYSAYLSPLPSTPQDNAAVRCGGRGGCAWSVPMIALALKDSWTDGARVTKSSD